MPWSMAARSLGVCFVLGNVVSSFGGGRGSWPHGAIDALRPFTVPNLQSLFVSRIELIHWLGELLVPSCNRLWWSERLDPFRNSGKDWSEIEGILLKGSGKVGAVPCTDDGP